MTRATRKKAKPGQLRMFYGRLPNDSAADVCTAWGDGCSSRDAKLLNWIMCSERPPSMSGELWNRSLIEELKDRGYDLDTLEFSIKKRADAP